MALHNACCTLAWHLLDSRSLHSVGEMKGASRGSQLLTHFLPPARSSKGSFYTLRGEKKRFEPRNMEKVRVYRALGVRLTTTKPLE